MQPGSVGRGVVRPLGWLFALTYRTLLRLLGILQLLLGELALTLLERVVDLGQRGVLWIDGATKTVAPVSRLN